MKTRLVKFGLLDSLLKILTNVSCLSLCTLLLRALEARLWNQYHRLLLPRLLQQSGSCPGLHGNIYIKPPCLVPLHLPMSPHLELLHLDRECSCHPAFFPSLPNRLLGNHRVYHHRTITAILAVANSYVVVVTAS